MIHKPIVNRLLIIGFMILVGYCIVKAIYSQSTIGVILAVVGFTAGLHFLHLLKKARQEANES